MVPHHLRVPSPIEKPVVRRVAARAIVMPCSVTVVRCVAGPSTQSHSGYPTAAIPHSLMLGSGPTFATGIGMFSLATAARAATAGSIWMGAASAPPPPAAPVLFTTIPQLWDVPTPASVIATTRPKHGWYAPAAVAPEPDDPPVRAPEALELPLAPDPRPAPEPPEPGTCARTLTP